MRDGYVHTRYPLYDLHKVTRLLYILHGMQLVENAWPNCDTENPNVEPSGIFQVA